MAKVVEIRTEPAICSIPLHQAVYCENCNTISNSRAYRCGVCGSEAVLRVEPILNRDPDPPGRASFPAQLSLLRVVGAYPASVQPTTHLNLRGRTHACICPSRPGTMPSWQSLLGRLITLSQVALSKFEGSDAEDKIQRATRLGRVRWFDECLGDLSRTDPALSRRIDPGGSRF